MGSRLTIAFSEVEKAGVVAAATEFLPVVHEGLFHGLVPAEDHHRPGPQVHCVHWAIFLAQLGGRKTEVTAGSGALGSLPLVLRPPPNLGSCTLVREVIMSLE